MHMKDKKLEVSAIENGTVIDHIPANALFKVISILNLDKLDKQITFGTNLDSKKLGKKAIVKLSDTFFIDKEINKIALGCPTGKTEYYPRLFRWLRKKWLKFLKK